MCCFDSKHTAHEHRTSSYCVVGPIYPCTSIKVNDIVSDHEDGVGREGPF